MGTYLFNQRVVSLLILQLSFIWLDRADCIVSQWDPFCKEEILYTPYVRIFQNGRSGAILKDRGPGFVDVAGLQDIFVCTNGLVMLYYSKPMGNSNGFTGEVYEHGELHWAPHHCELYNPSSTALGIDQPKKTLMSILLIGHPQDYRRPAIQLFLAPTYDVVLKNYVNLTSITMISGDGECILEKGVEQARLRVRIVEPILDPPPHEPTTWFCQLDSQRKLGQTGIINLHKHDYFPEFPPTTLYEYEFGPETHNRKTGPAIRNRYRASQEDYSLIYQGNGIQISQDADRVYAALLNDRPIRFVGCLEYPDFSVAQFNILNEKAISILGDPSLGVPQIDLGSEMEYVPDATAPDFWSHVVDDPRDPKVKETRFELYTDKKGWLPEHYSDAAEKVQTKKDELENAIKTNEPQNKINQLRQALKGEEMMFSLWPYKEIYIATMIYLLRLQAVLEDQWRLTMDAIDHSRTPGTIIDTDDIATYDAKTVAEQRLEVLRNLSSYSFYRRFDPYNMNLATEYNENLEKLKELDIKLRQQSKFVGPYISDAETISSEFNLYKRMTKTTLTDFENAIKKMEKTKEPVEKPTFGVPFEKYFSDSRIVISDARDKEDDILLPKEITAPGTKACHALPVPIETCSGIKPEAHRACQLSKNRKGQGIDWSTGSEWKQRVLDLLESVYTRVCPYISDDFVTSINRLLKGYLMASPAGTGLKTPINGSRMYKADHNYQEIIYNSTYLEMGNLTMFDPTNPFTLPPTEAFWDQIISSLEDCDVRARPMEFYFNEESETSITLRKTFLINKTETFINVEDMFMQEKADYEYSFNWAIDMNWRIFATVLGYCMPHYETSIPLISAQFYAMYSKHFLHPLRQIWMSNRDNPVLKTILGSFYGTGKGERWGKICMESSFIVSGDRTYRPPRYLYVNAFTEMNYFTTGPLAGTSGRLVDAVI